MILNNDIFIKRAKAVHGQKYDYSRIIYKGCNIKIDLICPKHGIFKQRPSGHLSGKGCEKCARELPHYNELTTDKFIEKAKVVHGNKYDYSIVDYKKSNIKIKILCSKHGPFEQTPNNHLMGMGCIQCGVESNALRRKLNTQNFIFKAKTIHGNKYDYSKLNYVNCFEKVEIICLKHGIFMQSPCVHLVGKGCPTCGRWSLLTTQIFKDRSKKKHGNKYDYSLVDYKNSRTKVKIICPKHGVFEQLARGHLKGQGCPICLESQGETKIGMFLNANKVAFKREKSFEECRDKNPLQFDFYLSDLNICIEFDGLQHYRPVDYFGGKEVFNKTKKSDAIKTDFCKKEGIKLIRISYKNNDQEIDSMLKNEILNPNLAWVQPK